MKEQLPINPLFNLKKDKIYEIKDPSGTTNGKGTWYVQNEDVLVTKSDYGRVTKIKF